MGQAREGGPHGSVNENKFFNNVPDDLAAEPRRARRSGRPEVFQSLSVGLDVRRQYTVPALGARDLPRRRLRRLHSALAQGDQSQGRDPEPVRARDRHGPDGDRSAWHRGTDRASRRCSVGDRRCQPEAHLRRLRRADEASHAVLRDVRPPRRSITTVGVRCARSPAPRSPRRE